MINGLQNGAGMAKTWPLNISVPYNFTSNSWLWHLNINFTKGLKATPSDPPLSEFCDWTFIDQFLFTEVETFLLLLLNLDILFVYV